MTTGLDYETTCNGDCNQSRNCDCAVGVMFLAGCLAVAFNGGIARLKEKQAAAQGTRIHWPCPLPAAEGTSSIATIKKRGDTFDLTCRDIDPLIKPMAPKDAQ